MILNKLDKMFEIRSLTNYRRKKKFFFFKENVKHLEKKTFF